MMVEADVVQIPRTFIDWDTGMFQPEVKTFDQNGLVFAHSISVVKKFKTFVHVLNLLFLQYICTKIKLLDPYIHWGLP